VALICEVLLRFFVRAPEVCLCNFSSGLIRIAQGQLLSCRARTEGRERSARVLPEANLRFEGGGSPFGSLLRKPLPVDGALPKQSFGIGAGFATGVGDEDFGEGGQCRLWMSFSLGETLPLQATSDGLASHQDRTMY
jgi:hypothetical protein